VYDLDSLLVLFMLNKYPNSTEAPTTKASSLASRIRADIIRGVFAPGSKLRTQELADRYDVSLIPMREALSRLANSGFVRAEDQRGFRVAETSPSELTDITSTRLLIEKDALRRSIALGDLAWESNLVATHHRLSQLKMQDTSAPGVARAWDEAHGAFHAALLAACGSKWLQTLALDLREQTSRYRHLSVQAEHVAPAVRRGHHKTPLRDVAAEHLSLMKAALERNGDLATQLLEQHLQKTTDLVLLRSSGARKST
jgi:GntR family transcriptional regulator, carbon starvation induced regulator